jgi:uncharacterized coiled-coil protein SlyX
MDPTLTGVLIGAVAGILGGYLSGLQQARLEYKKWEHTRQDETIKEINLAVAELMKKMAATVQAISWFTWEADYRPDRINKKAVDNYDLEMRKLFPEIDSALIVVSALSNKAYEQLSPLVLKIYELDLEVSRSTRMIIKTPDKAIKGIAGHKDVAFQLKSEIMKSVANISSAIIKGE